MAQAYTPGLRITEATVLRKERRLPLPGKVHVQVGQRVHAQDLVASTNLPGNVTTVNVARDLNLQPDEVAGAMLKATGDSVAPGELIAEVKALWGLFHATATSPVLGTVENVSEITGQVLVRGEPIPVELEAYLSGEVVEVLGDEGVAIETSCALVQGIFGFGGEAYGVLAVRADGPDSPLDAGDIGDECKGKVIVGGSLVTEAALMRAVECGASGIVVGGIGHRDLDSFLGYPIGVAVTGSEEKGITVVVTEGFGQISMAQRTFDLLKARDGMEASINGATQIRAGVIRPEIIVAYSEGEAPQIAAASKGAGLVVGAQVRLIREPYFGILATVAELPEEPREVETGAKVRVLVAQIPDGSQVEVPRANVEMMEN